MNITQERDRPSASGRSFSCPYGAEKDAETMQGKKWSTPELRPRVSNCRSKYCPALIVMLYRCMGYKTKEIADVTGYKTNGVRSVLVKHGLADVKPRLKKSDFDLDQIEYEYVTLGISSYKLSEKYGVNRATISEWMRQRGHHLGKGAHQEGREGKTKANGEFVYSERMRKLNQLKHESGERRFAQQLVESQGGRFEYVGGFRDGGKLVATIRCDECGYEFVHGITDMDKMWRCPRCSEAEQDRLRQQRDQEKEARRYERMFEEIREYALDKTCKICGSTFHSVRKTALYCSDRCRNRANERRNNRLPSNFRHYYHVKYGELYLEHYDPSITLKKLYERDGGVCQICGEPCDWNDTEWGSHGPTYPSIDHIVPRAKGGEHKWSNVQLAHCICNSRKRDLMGDELQEVMLNAS